jgi:hypothetical protein
MVMVMPMLAYHKNDIEYSDCSGFLNQSDNIIYFDNLTNRTKDKDAMFGDTITNLQAGD